MMADSCYNFGVEIETVVHPYARRPDFTKDTQWYEQLVQRLKNRNVPATYDAQGRYVMHPDYHSSKWFITRDSSLVRRHNDFGKCQDRTWRKLHVMLSHGCFRYPTLY